MGKLIIANWKANPATFSEALKLAKASDFKNVAVAPPYVYLQPLSWTLKKATLCAQDTFWEASGPYTGEITPSQLKNLKVKYVIVGHSERRKLGETDLMINNKVKAAMKAGLKVILCIGEDWLTRRKGITAAKNFVASQLKGNLRGIRKKEARNRNLLIAYEPIWSISTSKGNRIDTPEDATQMIRHIRNILDTRYLIHNTNILYGGSVNSKNAKSFLSQPEIAGALAGGASLNPKEFKTIIKISNSL